MAVLAKNDYEKKLRLGQRFRFLGRRGGGKKVETNSASSAVQTVAVTASAAPVAKPPNDVLAGAAARACSQTTIHPLDSIKVRMQSGRAKAKATSKWAPPKATATAAKPKMPAAGAVKGVAREAASLYRGVGGAAGGAGFAIGAYYAFYGSSLRLLKEYGVPIGTAAFLAGATAAAGSSIVKVPIAVCVRSVQAGVYPHFFAAARQIKASAGVRGLYTGYLPTLLEDVPDMAVKFAAYEVMRATYSKVTGNNTNAGVDLVFGGTAGAAAAAATTPFDVVKTRMMCNAKDRPTMIGAAKTVMKDSGAKGFLVGIGPRALSSSINSAVFFMFFEAMRAALERRDARRADLAAQQQQRQSTLVARRNGRAPATDALRPQNNLHVAGMSLALPDLSDFPKKLRARRAAKAVNVD